MNGRVLAALVLVAACPSAAFAAPPDDTGELADALIAQGWPDLAEDLLARTARERPLTWSEEATAVSAHLAVLGTAAMEIEDPYWRKEALLDVLAQTDTFVGRFEGTTAAGTRKSGLPELVLEIGETIVAAIRKSQDAVATEVLQTQGEAMLARAEKDVKSRIDLLAAAEDRDEEQDFALMAARYSHARALYVHALLFPCDSARRKELCSAALAEYEEFDLDDTETIFSVYADIDMGLCLRELGKNDDALARFDRAIAIRESWGPRDPTTTRFPVPSRYFVDLVRYAMFQKACLLSDLGRTAEAAEVNQDRLTSLPELPEGE